MGLGHVERGWRLTRVVDDEVVDVIVVDDVRNVTNLLLALATVLLAEPVRKSETIIVVRSLGSLLKSVLLVG